MTIVPHRHQSGLGLCGKRGAKPPKSKEEIEAVEGMSGGRSRASLHYGCAASQAPYRGVRRHELITRKSTVDSIADVFAGTFLFVGTISTSVVLNPVQAPFAIGFSLMAIVFAFGYFSGGHFNPAVSFGVALIGGMPRKKAITYATVQFLGAILGAFYGVLVHGEVYDEMVAPMPSDETPYGILRAIAAEVFVTFALVTVVLQVACSRQKDNHFYGFAIGMTVLSGAMAVGKVSGGAFNPAVSTALQLAKCVITGRCKPLGYIWLYWISHFGAAALAAGCFLTIHPRAGIKQHTGADEDNADSWTVLPSASTETIKRATQLMPRIARASNVVEANQVPMVFDLAKTGMTDFTSSQQLPSEQLLNKS